MPRPLIRARWAQRSRTDERCELHGVPTRQLEFKDRSVAIKLFGVRLPVRGLSGSG